MKSQGEKIYHALVQAAQDGSQCPSNHELAIEAGCQGANSVSSILSQLEKAGKIRRFVVRGTRAVKLPAIDKVIFRPLQSKKIKPEKFEDPDDKAVAEAKIVIRRAGFKCFRATVIGGPKGKWVVGRTDRLMGRNKLLAYAVTIKARKAAA